MGVPGFFLWLINKYNNKNILVKEINEKIDYLLLDSNCLFHPKCFEIVSNNYTDDTDKLEMLMFENIIEYIKYLIDFVKPTEGVYIAVDGVAPMAKIKQQRLRRFKSIADKRLWDKIKTKHGKPLSNFWNNSAITPGTEFMEKLHNYILEWIDSTELNKLKIIYSSYKTPGEGEHKLLDFIKNNGENLKYVIYGLDADLIFLSLVKDNTIYLLRENTIINKKNEETLLYVDINEMKKAIYHTFNEKSVKLMIFKNVINDFIFLCYLIGNDFLPHIMSLNIKNYGLEYLIETYIAVYNQENSDSISIVSNDKYNKINTDFFKKILKILYKKEDDILKTHEPKRMIKNIFDPYEKEVFMIENLYIKIDDPIKIGDGTFNEYRNRYYKHYWNVTDNELEEFSKNLVEQYLMGLKWTTNYYFKKCDCWSWYYPFDNPPFIYDIYKYIDTVDINKIKFSTKKNVDSLLQLMLVLPIQSNNLLPDYFSKKITTFTEISYLYPVSFKQDFLHKSKYWMGVPKLPPLNVSLVTKFYNKYKNNLTDDEKKRNETVPVYVFNK